MKGKKTLKLIVCLLFVWSIQQPLAKELNQQNNANKINNPISWKAFQEMGLTELAIASYNIEVPIPEQFTNEHLKYIYTKANLLIENGQSNLALQLIEEGFKELLILKKERVHPVKTNRPNNSNWIGLFNSLKAMCLINKGDYEGALLILLQPKISESDETLQVKNQLNSIACYLNLNKYATAKHYLDEVSKKIKATDINLNSIYFYNLLSTYYQRIHQYELAFKQLKIHDQYLDTLHRRALKKHKELFVVKKAQSPGAATIDEADNSFLNEHTINKKINSQLSFFILLTIFIATIAIGLYINIQQRKKRQHQIIRQNELLRLQSEEITIQNNRNKWLVQEIQHRVKNNLQIINSLINLQKRKSKETLIENFATIIENRIHSIALVHQQLLISENTTQVNMHQYIFQMVEHLKSIYFDDAVNIQIQCEIDAIYMHPETVTPIGLILNEAITNAYKYAFVKDAKGIILIQLKKTAKQVQLIISDNGVGFNLSAVSNKSTGLKLIQNMINQLKGKHELISQNGTSHIITLHNFI